MAEVERILHRYPPDCRAIRATSLGAAGGMSGAQFWRIVAPCGELALRRWPPGHPTPERLRFIHAVLRHAMARGIRFIPVPIATAGGGETFVRDGGHLWELAAWMPGTANFERAATRAKLCSAMRALAEFHLATADFAGPSSDRLQRAASPAVGRRLGMLRELMSGGSDELAHAIRETSWPELAGLARQFVSLLPRVVPLAIVQLEPLADMQLALQPCLRDVWHDHVLFTGDEVTGLIDFGAMQIETPAGDVARLLGSLAGEDVARWRVGVEAYSGVRQLSADELRAVTAFDTSGTVLAGCNWVRWIYIEGRAFDDHSRIIERFRRIVARAAKL